MAVNMDRYPIGHSVKLKEEYDTVKMFLQILKSEDWVIYVRS